MSTRHCQVKNNPGIIPLDILVYPATKVHAKR